MCGFAVYIGKKRRTKAQKEAAIKGLTRRGPDSTGWKEIETADRYCFMAHSRLAIIDGKNSRSDQPYRISDIGWLVFNGEIYNYKEIKEKQVRSGYNHLTDSDTEVLANAIASAEVNAIRQLRGMWSYVYVSNDLKEVTYSRDVFGEKPLFIKEVEDGIFLGSTPRQILDLMDNDDIEIDEDSVRQYLYMGHRGYYSRGCSPWKGIKAVKPNSRVVRTVSGVHVDRLFSRKYDSRSLEHEDIERIRNCAIHEMRNSFNTDADVKSAVLLSGGLDSNLLAGAWLESRGDGLNAYTVKTNDARYDESDLVDAILKENRAINHKYVKTEGQKSFHDVIEIVRSGADFLPSATSVALASVIRQASQDGIKVIHMGCGGDELFGGYLVHHLFFLGGIQHSARYQKEYDTWVKKIKPGIRNKDLQCPIKFASRYKSGAWLDTAEEEAFFKRTDLFRDYKSSFEKSVENGNTDLLKIALDHDLFNGSIPSQLAAADYICMHFGVENRSGILSKELLRELRLIDSSYYFSNGQSKAIMRECLGHLISHVALECTNKVGFNIDFSDFCSSKDLREMINKSSNRHLIEESVDVDRLIDLLSKGSVSNGVSRLAFRVAVVAAFEESP